MLLLLLILLPLVMAAANLAHWNLNSRRIILTLGSLAMFAVSIALAAHVERSGPLSVFDGMLRVDALSAVLLLTVTGVAAAAFPYAGGYLSELQAHQAIARQEIRRFSILLPIFSLMTVLVPVFDNLGLVWGAMEAATLSAVFLVAFYRTAEALEAAWKFLILTSVGSLIGLVGTLVFYAAATRIGGPDVGIDWTTLRALAPQLSPGIVVLGFTLVLIGYGTKAGIAPMHTWMPDAYSRAPSPVCALLSGAELSCAVYIIFRFVPIASHCLHNPFVSDILAAFGITTLVVAAIFVIAQREYKRLLAYSSMEHTALMLLGVAFGGPIGLFGALWQLVMHAVIKSAMFFGAGNVLMRYETTEMERIHGVLRRMPLTGVLWLLSTVAIVGAPPFALFGSDLSILEAAFLHHFTALGTITVLLLAVIYITLFVWFVRMIYDGPAEGDAATQGRHDASAWSLVPMFCLTVLALGLGLFLPSGLAHLLRDGAELIH